VSTPGAVPATRRATRALLALPGGLAVAGGCGLALIIALWFDWYGVRVSGTLARGAPPLTTYDGRMTGWQAFSTIDVVLALMGIVALVVVVARALDRVPALPFAVEWILVVAGTIAAALVAYRIAALPFQDSSPAGFHVHFTRHVGPFVALLAAAGVAGGGLAAGRGAARRPRAVREAVEV
jgi:hypothetical protein